MAAPKKKRATKKKPIRKKKRSRRGQPDLVSFVPPTRRRGLGPASGGQSGDTEGISRAEEADSESEEELLEEGQTLEAEAVHGVEHAREPDEGEVTTSELPEDDVPAEYTNGDKF